MFCRLGMWAGLSWVILLSHAALTEVTWGGLEQRSGNYGLKTKSSLATVFVNKVLLEHSHAHSFFFFLFRFHTLISIFPVSKVKCPYKDQIKYIHKTEIMKLLHMFFLWKICGNILCLKLWEHSFREFPLGIHTFISMK